MDDILQSVKEDITLDCEEGSSLSRVWEYVDLAQQQIHRENGVDPEPSSGDRALQAYIWPYIVRLLGMIFLSEGTVIYDSTDPASADSEAARQFLDLGASEVEQQYPAMNVRAPLPTIYKKLFGREDGLIRVLSSTMATKILMCLSRARGKGVPQAWLSKGFAIDARSVFHYLKILDKHGLIIKHPTFYEGSNTNQLMLRRFADQAQVKNHDEVAEVPEHVPDRDSLTLSLVRMGLRPKIAQILQQSESGYMVESDLFDMLKLDFGHHTHRKYFHTVLRDLYMRGCLEPLRVKLRDRSLDTTKAAEVGGQGEGPGQDGEPADAEGAGVVPGYRVRRCVHFLKPYVEGRRIKGSMGVPLSTKQAESEMLDSIAGPEEDDDAEEPVSSSDDDFDMDMDKEKEDVKELLSMSQFSIGMVSSLPMDMQVFRVIAFSGTRGIVTKALQIALNLPAYKTISRSLTWLERAPVFLPDGSFPGIVTSAEERVANRRRKNEKLVLRVNENVGREHRIRYYANPVAQPLIDSLTADRTRGDAAAIIEGAISRAIAATSMASVDEERRDDDVMEVVPDEVVPDEVVPDEVVPDEDQPDEVVPDEDQPDDGQLYSGWSISRCKDAAARCGNIEDMIEEAKTRRANVVQVIREHVVTQILEQESIIGLTIATARQCEQIYKAFLELSRNASLSTRTMIESAQRHALDKRTLVRTINSLSDQGLLWCQTVSPPVSSGKHCSGTAKGRIIAISRSVAPDDPTIKVFVDHMNDQRATTSYNGILILGKIEDIQVQRTEGAEERDMKMYQKMCGQRKEAGSLRNNRAKRARRTIGGKLAKRARIKPVNPKVRSEQGIEWRRLLGRVEANPKRIARIVELHRHLLAAVTPDKVDNSYIFPNGAFASLYLFNCLPVEMVIELCGGLAHLSILLPYIRDGKCVTDDASASDSDVDIDMDKDDLDSPQRSSAADVRRRLNTPINELPSPLFDAMKECLNQSRSFFGKALYALQVLQLIRPFDSLKEIVDLPEPPDARDAFSSISFSTSRLIRYGYQLTGKARLITEEGCMRAVDTYDRSTPIEADLTTDYVNDVTYDMFDPHAQLQYWCDLSILARKFDEDIPGTNPLFGIARPNSWARNHSLTLGQMRVLEKYVNIGTLETPLSNVDHLKEAACKAGVTSNAARIYFQARYAELAVRKRRREVGRLSHRARLLQKRLTKAAQTQEKAKGKRPQRMEWSGEEAERVLLCDAILWNHARAHKHTFAASRSKEMFPNRQHIVNPVGGIRQQWRKMATDPAYKQRNVHLSLVWQHVLRDAVANGKLEDDADIDAFNFREAVLYFEDLLRRVPLESLLEKYASEIDADLELDQEAAGLPGSGLPLIHISRRSEGHRYRPGRGIGTRVKLGRKMVTVMKYRLPATMQSPSCTFYVEGIGQRYEDSSLSVFGEDMFGNGQIDKKQSEYSYISMVTTHARLRSVADYSCPVTTLLEVLPGTITEEPDRMDIDGNTPGADAHTEVIASAIEHPLFPDNMQSLWPLTRTISADKVASRLQALLQGGPSTPATFDDDHDKQDISGEAHYADVASMEALILNLTLTPLEDYNVETGHELLMLKTAAALDSLRLLGRNGVVNTLQKRAMAIGLSNPSSSSYTSKKDDDQEPGSEDHGAQPNAGTSTVAIHTTSGMTRIETKIATSYGGVARPAAADEESGGEGQAKDAISAGHTKDDNNDPSAPAEMRQVPGRGFAASGKFLSTITTTLPQEVLDGDEELLRQQPDLAEPLSCTEFENLCTMMAEGSLRVRPSYGYYGDRPMSGLLGFRRNEEIADTDFAMEICRGSLCEVLDDSTMDMAVEVDAEAALGLSPEHLATCSRLVVDVVDTLGPLGGSIDELYTLISKLAAGRAKSLFGDLAKEVSQVLLVRGQLSTLVDLLAQQHKLFAVGSSDLRFVSERVYRKYWALSTGSLGTVFAPRLGQNLSGTTNKRYTTGMLWALLGRIAQNPWISQTALVRRYFAPLVPKREVLRYVAALVRVGAIRVQVLDEVVGGYGASKPCLVPTTYYSVVPGYRRLVPRLADCSVATDVGSCPEL
ncbi:hypothetical protein GGF46_003988 [Coemansia sp. RSA 552]|nr:hypothetical protein GGF46_003988 [Coemansia sp. RSA 552]